MDDPSTDWAIFKAGLGALKTTLGYHSSFLKGSLLAGAINSGAVMILAGDNEYLSVCGLIDQTVLLIDAPGPTSL